MMRSMADWQLPLARAPLYFFFGTFFPARRASDSPMAMACLRLLTFAPEPPLRSVPRFISCIAFLTFRPLALLYFVAMAYLLVSRPDFCLYEHEGIIWINGLRLRRRNARGRVRRVRNFVVLSLQAHVPTRVCSGRLTA